MGWPIEVVNRIRIINQIAVLGLPSQSKPVVPATWLSYSNHATDPASGRLCNAFDLVRLHLYGDRDDDAGADTPVNKLPSYTAMTELAREDDAVKVLVTSERLEKARADFAMPEDAGDWMEQMIAAGLTVDKRGNPEPTINNVYIILTHDPALMSALAFNGFKDRLVAVKALPWRDVTDPTNGDTWTDHDDSELRWLPAKHSVL